MCIRDRVRISAVTRLESTFPYGLKTALRIVPDLSGSRRKNRIEHYLRVGNWHKKSEFHQELSLGSQHPDISKTQSFGDHGVHAVGYVVEVGVDGVCLLYTSRCV